MVWKSWETIRTLYSTFIYSWYTLQYHLSDAYGIKAEWSTDSFESRIWLYMEEKQLSVWNVVFFQSMSFLLWKIRSGIFWLEFWSKRWSIFSVFKRRYYGPLFKPGNQGWCGLWSMFAIRERSYGYQSPIIHCKAAWGSQES